MWRTGDWHCDYASRFPVSREHYGENHFVLRVFWKWQEYVRSQGGCARALSGLWGRLERRGWLGLLDQCLNGPMERP